MTGQKQRNPVQIAAFRPEPLLPEGLLGVRRPSGEVEGDVAAGLRRITGVAENMAQAAARNAGEQAGQIAGQRADFRPIGLNTTRAQAYDQAGTRVYSGRLEANFRADLQGLYEQHRADPGGFNLAAEELRRLYERDHVFDAIRSDFELGAQRLVDAYAREAAGNAEARLRDEARASLVGQLNEIETVAGRQAASLNPGSPAGGELIADTLAASERAIDGAVASGAVSAEAGARMKIEARRSTLTKFHAAQAERLSGPQEIEDYRARLNEEFAAGRTGMDAAAHEALDRELSAMARARAADDNRASRALEARGQSIAERIALGGEANREEMAQFIADSQSAPDGDERVERAYDQIAIANTIKHATLAEGDAMLRDMERRLREGGSAREAAALTFARSAQSAKRKMVADDPIGAGIAYGLNLSADPLDFSAGDPQAIAAQMRLRLVDARTAASHFGAQPQIFRPGETRQIAAILREQPEAVPAIAGGLVAGVPADALPQMLRELGREAPQIAQIGRIVAAGGSQSAALDALRGMARDETGKKRPDIAASIRGEANRQIAGDSLANLPDDMQAIYGAANSIARARMADAGHDPRDAEAARQIYDEALQDAAGRNFHDRHSYGGFARVQDGWLTSGRALLLPADLRSDGWGELMSAMDEKAMAALGLRSGYTTRDLERAYPVNLPGGIAFSQTDPDNGAPRWLASATGGPLIVSAAELREATRDRAPHLWRQ